ncbi:hypothetical protein SteCoe_3796 [Stentor coeruleus]|uniref:Uncharacterized protein n=1 Tax=Stentor coeruleus TaxID=5963 RepID=A0A1R2CW39_9CILI|nr:hypothetical protein SteCoe_3796 [Stentor coeruleus]
MDSLLAQVLYNLIGTLMIFKHQLLFLPFEASAEVWMHRDSRLGLVRIVIKKNTEPLSMVSLRIQFSPKPSFWVDIIRKLSPK